MKCMFLLFLLLGVVYAAHADQLRIPTAGEARPCTIECPSGGMTMEVVKSRFGEPQQTYPAVGVPPITRWVYRDFNVYFEHEQVITAFPRH